MSNIPEQHAKYVKDKHSVAVSDIRTLAFKPVDAETIWKLICKAFPSQNILN